MLAVLVICRVVAEHGGEGLKSSKNQLLYYSLAVVGFVVVIVVDVVVIVVGVSMVTGSVPGAG